MSETCHEFAERIWGKKLTPEEVDILLWSCTAFPCVDVEFLENQLTKVRNECNGDIGLAQKQADEATEKAMAGIKTG